MRCLLEQSTHAAQAEAGFGPVTMCLGPVSGCHCRVKSFFTTVACFYIPSKCNSPWSRCLKVDRAIGLTAQARLACASILVVGSGGLGSPAALYLAAAGVGRLGILDRDNVDLSNLHRQVIHSEATVGKHKVHSAAASCRAVNSSIQVGSRDRNIL